MNDILSDLHGRVGERVRAELVRNGASDALRDPAIARNISENLQITMRIDGPDQLGKFLAEQMKLWGPVVREHNIKGDT